MPEGEELVEGFEKKPELVDGTWGNWQTQFIHVRGSFDRRFKVQLRKKMAERMPHLNKSLDAVNWPKTANWKKAARFIGSSLEKYARLAAEFCPWADTVREIFDSILRLPPANRVIPVLPDQLNVAIPSDLKRWNPLRRVLKTWDRRKSVRVLAALHEQVFLGRGYTRDDCWLRCEDDYPIVSKGFPTHRVTEGIDCRWSNVVNLLGPRG